MDWVGIITPAAVVSAIVAGVVSLIAASINAYVLRRGSERAIQIDNVTKERAKWRDKIRAKALEVNQAARAPDKIDTLHLLRLDFSVNLNPLDDEDRAILDVIRRLLDGGVTPDLLDEFGDRVSLLLKHDWDRAKYESTPHFIFGRRPARTSYAQLQERRASPI